MYWQPHNTSWYKRNHAASRWGWEWRSFCKVKLIGLYRLHTLSMKRAIIEYITASITNIPAMTPNTPACSVIGAIGGDMHVKESFTCGGDSISITSRIAPVSSCLLQRTLTISAMFMSLLITRFETRLGSMVWVHPAGSTLQGWILHGPPGCRVALYKLTTL